MATTDQITRPSTDATEWHLYWFKRILPLTLLPVVLSAINPSTTPAFWLAASIAVVAYAVSGVLLYSLLFRGGALYATIRT